MSADSSTNRVAVVIPAYNAGKFIAEAISSALTQGEIVSQIIVVDDGSSDDTAQVVRKILDPRIQLLTQTNSGPAIARNKGWRATSTPWIAFLDADDTLAPNAFAELLKVASSNSAKPIIPYGREELYGNHISGSPVHLADLATHDGSLFADIALNYRGTIFCALFPRRCLEAINGFDESVKHAEDFDFALRLASQFEFAHTNAAVYRARMHGENRHRQFPEADYQAQIAAIERVFANRPSDATLRRKAIAHRHWILGKSFQADQKPGEARAAFANAIRAWPFKLDAWRQYLLG